MDSYYQKKKLEAANKKFLSEEERKRYELEKKYSQGNSFTKEEQPKQAPTSVFDGINQDEFTLRSHEAIRNSLINEGVEDIDEISEEEDEWDTPSRYY